MATAVHVTHEAVHQAGGIGAVLRGLITARSYAARIERTLLLGPLVDPDRPEPLGADGEVLYDSARGIGSAEVGPALDRVTADSGVRLVYGRRRLRQGDEEARPEVLLVDVRDKPRGLDDFKYFLGVRFGLDSRRYEHYWEYEQYLRLAEPGFEGVRALIGGDPGPIFLIAHEFMGMGAALKAMLAGDRRFKTVFYAHEVATVRAIVEESPGHDVMFYNVLRMARATGAHIEDFFGPQDGYFKHALIRQAWRCDAVLAVGDWVVEELRFLGPEFARRHLDLVYNGMPAVDTSLEEKAAARRRLQQYARGLLRSEPDLFFTHVTRLVISKGLWRDLLVLAHLDRLLADQGRQAAFIVLATEVGRREPDEVQRMVAGYDWPLVHREGLPDLSPGELAFDLQVRAFSARARAIKVLFVNQFGWDPASCGETMPADMEFLDLRRGSDVEFGQSIYEPFGIAQVEPLSFGSISVVSDVCGCIGFVERSTRGREIRGFVRGNYTRLEGNLDIGAARALGAEAAQKAEAEESRRVAAVLAGRLPVSQTQARALLRQGFETAKGMSWERVGADYFLPALARVEE